MTLIMLGAVLAGRQSLSMRNLALAAVLVMLVAPEAILVRAFSFPSPRSQHLSRCMNRALKIAREFATSALALRRHRRCGRGSPRYARSSATGAGSAVCDFVRDDGDGLVHGLRFP
jgi:hypothetical protein